MEMIYLLPDGSSMMKLSDGFGVMTTHERYKAIGILEGRKWAMDNSCYTGKFNWNKIKAWLLKYREYHSNCLFIVLPDVVGDAKKTLELYDEWYSEYLTLNLPIAFVAQDGQTPQMLPNRYDVLFIGGTTQFKISKKAVELMQFAKEWGKSVHVGRVNYWNRIQWAFENGADSVDGTRISFQRNYALKDLQICMKGVGKQKCMF